MFIPAAILRLSQVRSLWPLLVLCDLVYISFKGPAEGRLRVREFLSTLKTHWWPWPALWSGCCRFETFPISFLNFTFVFRRTTNLCNALWTIAKRSYGMQLTYTDFVNFLCTFGARRSIRLCVTPALITLTEQLTLDVSSWIKYICIYNYEFNIIKKCK